jgi:inosose dehydratase
MNPFTVSDERIEHPRGHGNTLTVGTAPVNWNNDDLPGWRPHAPFAEVLDAMASAGYQGTEFGADFPHDSIELKTALRMRDLELCGSFQWFHFQDSDQFSTELDGLDHLLPALAGAGCRHLIVASAMTPERIAIAGRVSEHGTECWSEKEWEHLQAGLASIRDRVQQWHIQTHFHNHVGSHVESPAEVETLINFLPELVDLCFDTGHYALGGGDPADFVGENVHRIGYLHLKDVDPNILTATRESGSGFLNALRNYVFCELGQGSADVPRIISTLESTGYAVWVIVEQDTCPGDPTETAKRNRDYLRDVCGI